MINDFGFNVGYWVCIVLLSFFIKFCKRKILVGGVGVFLMLDEGGGVLVDFMVKFLLSCVFVCDFGDYWVCDV